MHPSRRLAAIVAVDIVGYSRLMSEDETATALAVQARREAARDLVTGHGGRVVKAMGDGLLLEFPSVVSAVECALAVQKLMAERNAETPAGRRIVYRIGVNLGDVLVEGDDIIGDGVNIAARLESICEPGGLTISGAAYEHVKSRVAAQFVDLGEQTLRNMPLPVRAYAVRFGPAPAFSQVSPPERERFGRPALSLVVLPFDNLGGGPEQEPFVDGVVDNLTTDLSRLSGAFVIARNTAFTYRGKAVDLKQIGRELNVRYVVQGSVQRGGDRMRVNVQLLDAESGHHLWADRFDKPLADLFDMQDEIVSRIAGALNSQLVEAEGSRAERALNPDAMDLNFRALSLIYRATTPETITQAIALAEQALALDPDNVEALATCALANTLAGAGVSFQTANPKAALAAAEAALNRALTLRPNHARAHLINGYLRTFTNRVVEGIAECEHALALNRNLASAHGLIGIGKTFLGRPEETESYVLQAQRLSPRDSLAHFWLTYAAVSKNHLGVWEQAVEWSRRAIEANRSFFQPHCELAVALTQLGRLDEARAVMAEGLAIMPRLTISIARAHRTAMSSNPTYLAGLEPQFEALRRIGVPE